MKQLFSEKTEQFLLVAKVSDDRLKIFIEASPIEPRSVVSAAQINAILWLHIPQRLIHARVVEEAAEMLSRGESVSERRVSRGEEAQPGTDGKLVMMVKAFNQKPDLAQDERGFTRLNELHLFDNVHIGREIARIYPPHAGKDGFDAFGKVIAAKPGKPFKPSFDKKTIELRAGTGGHESLHALIDGYVEVEAAALKVVDTIVVSANVDFHTGNIDFIGSVTVRGDVMPGFTVRAVKGITVQGSVHKGSLQCSQGSIECRGSIIGGDRSQIIAHGNLSARVLHEVLAEVGGDVLVEKEAHDCALFIEGAFFSDNGALLGGETRSARGVQAKTIGLESTKKTKITLCSTIETRREFTLLLSQIESHERALNLLKLHLGPLAQKPDRVQLLHEEHKKKMTLLLEKMHSVERSLVALKAKKLLLVEKSVSVEGLRVNVIGKLYPGVEIHAGQHQYSNEEGMQGPKSLRYNPQDESFSWSEYQIIERLSNGEKGTKDDKKS